MLNDYQHRRGVKSKRRARCLGGVLWWFWVKFAFWAHGMEVLWGNLIQKESHGSHGIYTGERTEIKSTGGVLKHESS